MSVCERERERRGEEKRLVPKDFITKMQDETLFQWDITEIRYLLFRRDIQRRSMGKHNRRDYKGLDARENIHAGSLRSPLRSLGCNRVFPAIFYLPRRKRRYLLFPHRMPNLPKILTLWKTYGLGELPKYTKRPGPVHVEKQQLRADTTARSNLFLDEFMHDIIWRESRNFDLYLSWESRSKFLWKNSNDITDFSDREAFFQRAPGWFYAKSNIACIWNSRVTHLRCRIEKSYLEFWENS